MGCGNPCIDLSKKICRCEESESLERACIQRVNAEVGQRKASEEEILVCADLLDGCTCDKLAQKDWAACGMALE